MPTKITSASGLVPMTPSSTVQVVPITSRTVGVPKSGLQKPASPRGVVLCDGNNKISLQEMISAINENTANMNDFEIRISQNETDIQTLYLMSGGGSGTLNPDIIKKIVENSNDINTLFTTTEDLEKRVGEITGGDETSYERLSILEPIVEKNTDDIEIINQKFKDGAIIGDATATHAGVIRAVLTQNVSGLWVLSMTNDGTYA